MSELTEQIEKKMDEVMTPHEFIFYGASWMRQLLEERKVLVEALHGIHNDSLSHIGCLSRAEKALRQVGELP